MTTTRPGGAPPPFVTFGLTGEHEDGSASSQSLARRCGTGSSSGGDAMTFARRLGVAVASVLALLSALLVPTGALAASPSILVSQVTTSNKVIALTFDIGSDVGNLPRILEVLA